MTLETSGTRSRRSLLAAAVGGLGALVAVALGRPARTEAAAGDNLVIGQVNNAGSSQSVLVSTAGGAAFTLKDTATSGTGIFGWASATSGTGRGLYGRADSPNGFGLYALQNAGSGGSGAAVRGVGNSNVGVSGSSSGSTGVAGSSSSGTGVYGSSTSLYGVYGYSPYAGVIGESPTGNAGGFYGNVYVTGTLSKGGGAFRIDHPLDPAAKILQHSFVESPDMKNVYDGLVVTNERGEATIELPDWFDALNRDVRYQLTTIGDARAWVRRTLQGNSFGIATDKPHVEVSWQLTGIRRDVWAEAHRIAVELAKPGDQKGKYLHPVEHGQPESKGIDYEERRRAKAGLRS